jgi:hypothetical protein
MLPKDLTEQQEKDLIESYQNGATIAECEQAYGFKPGSLSNWFSRRGIKKIDSSVAEIDPAQLSMRVRHDQQVSGLKAEVTHYRKLYTEAIKSGANYDKLIAAATSANNAVHPVSVPALAYVIDKTDIQVPVSPLCDPHVGEVVDIEQMGGLNAYNIDIFNKRLWGWANTVLQLIELRRSYVSIDKIIVPLLGDMVSGEIHELAKSNEMNIMSQVVRGAHLIAQALIYIAQNFSSVEVPCVVGNHGRMELKPPSKDAWQSWDYLMYQQIAHFCSRQTNIKFTIPKTLIHVFQAGGRKVLMMHGDSLRGSLGIPWYGLIREVGRLRQTLQLYGRLEDELRQLQHKNGTSTDLLEVLAPYFDSIMMGHFHTDNDIDIGTGKALICGCVKGTCEYAFGRLHVASEPTQVLTYWNDKLGFLAKEIIYLKPYDNEQSKFIDAIPDVWAEAEV